VSYRRALVVRWSHRDQLAAVVVALTVAFLVGTTLLVLAAGAQTAAIAEGDDSTHGVTYYEDRSEAEAVAGQDAPVLPVTSVTVDGERTLAVGVPVDTYRFGQYDVPLGAPGTLGTITEPATHQLETQDGQVSVTVEPRGDAVLSPAWYAVNSTTIEELGAAGALVISPVEPTPLVSALPFFLRGTEQALQALSVAVLDAGLLVGVTIFSVTRMTVRDRMSTIKVIRATGGSPRLILGLFTVRAGLVTVVGTAAGYALGVVLTNAAVSVAVTLGFPTSLSLDVTPRVVRLLLPVMATILGIGSLAGLIATLPTVRRPVAQLTRDASGEASALDILGPSVLASRAVVPTTATLTAFMTFVILITAVSGAAAPVSTDDATVTDPDAVHPVASRIPTGYVDAFRAQGINASAEILLFEVVNNKPFPARGANFSAFTTVTDAELVRGRAPQNRTSAVIGADLARSLDLAIGDQVVLGGSTNAAVTRIHIVGVFEASGYQDDQLIMPLATARHLSMIKGNRVHLVRAERLPDTDTTGDVSVINLDAPATATTGSEVIVRLTVQNPLPDEQTVTIPVQYGAREQTASVTIPPYGQRRATVQFTAGEPGRRQVTADNVTTTVRVLHPDAVRIASLPQRAPTGSQPQLAVVGPNGNPANATVRVANHLCTTGNDGRLRLPLSEPGTYTVVVTRGESSTSRNITVAADASRRVSTSLTVTPTAPSVLTRPTARLRLENPWNQTLTRSITITSGDTSAQREVRLSPGVSETVQVALSRAPPGEHTVRTTVGDRRVTTTYPVRGDDRVTSVLATTGRRGETGTSRAIAVAFGNLRLLIGTLLVLAGLMTVGGTTATFASAVHARRRTLGVWRATGADPLAVLRLVLGDTLRLGSVAAVISLLLATVALTVLAKLGYLTVFGVSLSPVPGFFIAAGSIGASLLLTLLGATVATLLLLRVPPGRLLTDSVSTPRGEGDG